MRWWPVRKASAKASAACPPPRLTCFAIKPQPGCSCSRRRLRARTKDPHQHNGNSREKPDQDHHLGISLGIVNHRAHHECNCSTEDSHKSTAREPPPILRPFPPARHTRYL